MPRKPALTGISEASFDYFRNVGESLWKRQRVLLLDPYRSLYLPAGATFGPPDRGLTPMAKGPRPLFGTFSHLFRTQADCLQVPVENGVRASQTVDNAKWQSGCYGNR